MKLAITFDIPLRLDQITSTGENITEQVFDDLTPVFDMVGRHLAHALTGDPEACECCSFKIEPDLEDLPEDSRLVYVKTVALFDRVLEREFPPMQFAVR